MGQDDNLIQEGCALNELNGNSCLHRQVEEQHQYQQYAALNFSDDTKTKHGIEMNLGGHPVEYQVSDNVKLPRSIYDNGHHNWGPGHNSPGGIAMYNVNSYDQASFFTAYSPSPLYVTYDIGFHHVFSVVPLTHPTELPVLTAIDTPYSQSYKLRLSENEPLGGVFHVY